jgi:hypothetical protein
VISQAIQHYLEGRTSRVYRLRHAAGVLASFALTILALDADGLHAWATRMEVGPAQDFWLALIEPWHRAARAVGLTAPRRFAVAGADWLAEHFGGTDPSAALLARGWGAPGAPVRASAAAPSAAPAAPAEAPEAPPRVAGGEPADAPEEGPEEPASLPPSAEGADRGPTTVLLVGDSMMAANLASAIAQGLEGEPEIRLVQAHREATGLARPDVFDWPSVVPDLLDAHRPRLIVCSFGGNDAQRVRAGGRVLEYGDERWDELYHGRVRAMMQALAGADADVLWLGLPPMRSRKYDRRMQHLNTIFAHEARQLARVEFQETFSVVGDEDGGFAAYRRGPDGKLTRARMEDGVHYAAGGARAVAARVALWVRAKLVQRRTKTAALGPGPRDAEASDPRTEPRLP